MWCSFFGSHKTEQYSYGSSNRYFFLDDSSLASQIVRWYIACSTKAVQMCAVEETVTRYRCVGVVM